MAKNTTKTAAAPAKANKEKAAAPAPAASEPRSEFKFGIADIEKATGLQPASIRVGLRESDFEKTGRTWGWNSQKELDAVLKFFKARADKAPSMTPGKSPDNVKTAGTGKKAGNKKAA